MTGRVQERLTRDHLYFTGVFEDEPCVRLSAALPLDPARPTGRPTTAD